jgi:hypothetical protein
MTTTPRAGRRPGRFVDTGFFFALFAVAEREPPRGWTFDEHFSHRFVVRPGLAK